MTAAIVALGSNIGDRARTLAWAAERVKRTCAIPGSFRASHVYETPPWGMAAQPEFLNAIVLFMTPIPDPRALLDALLAIERDAGRLRGDRWGPRSLDLDLLDFDRAVVDAPGLTLPHPRIAERAFVLVPLCEIAPGWRHPLTGHTATEMLRTLDPDPSGARLHGPLGPYPDGEGPGADSAAT